MKESIHPDKGPFLRDLEPGNRFIGYYVLRSKQLEPFRDPARGYFLTLVLSDRSGQLIARVWDNAEMAYEDVLEGEIVKLDGETESFLERTQIRILRLRPAEPKEYDMRDMLPSSPRDPDEMLNELKGFINEIQNPHLSALVNIFFDDKEFIDQFVQAPAARRIHHAYLHGLLEHTLEILILAKTAIELYPHLDADLLFSGILLHDIGKVREYTWDLDINYTNEGRLLGHVVMANEMISKAIESLPEFPEELGLRLRHMLLSHHGRYEWGSPRRPKTLEAIALHQLENTSAQINRFSMLLDHRQPDKNWTEYDRLLRRQLYGSPEDDLSIEENSRRS